MIPVVDVPEAINSGNPLLRIDMRQMDPEDIQTMQEQSRDGFYSNKVLAPIREYSTNAQDAHIRKGIPTRPIQVTLPTAMLPEFKVRDFGSGLSYDSIANVYFKYWKSTKRFTNDENGCLGIGSKSAFSYTAIYTVTTWCEGMKTVITGQKQGFADVIYRQPITTTEEGVEITIPVLQKDIEKFTIEAMNFFKYWDMRPEFVNIDKAELDKYFKTMDAPPFLTGPGWAIRPSGYGRGDSVAYMGNVPYQIDWDQVRNNLSPEISVKIQGIFEFLESNLTTLTFPNGTLAFTPNRESLQYNEVTVAAISERLVLIFDTLLDMITSKICTASNLWEAKIIYNRIFRKELDGFDKGMFYGGNLDAVERLLRTRVQWQGITIKDGKFTELSSWDRFDGSVDSYQKGIKPVMTTYVKDTENKLPNVIKALKCKRRGNHNSIICSPKSLVIIQDTNMPRYVIPAAHHFFYNAGMDISQIYVLNLSEPDVKTAFFQNYAFDSVPALYISNLIDTLKPYMKNRVIYGGGSRNAGVPIYCPYFNIEDRSKSGNTPYWRESDTNARGIVGGVYVVIKKEGYGRGKSKLVELAGDTLTMSSASGAIQSVYELCDATGHTISKVYGITQRTADSVWFKKAIAAGQWVHLNDVMIGLVESLDADMLKKLRTFEDISYQKKIQAKTANTLLKGITNQESPAYRYCQIASDLIPYLRLHTAVCYFSKKFDDKTFTYPELKELANEVASRYPMMFAVSDMAAVANTIVDYINLVDSSLTK